MSGDKKAQILARCRFGIQTPYGRPLASRSRKWLKREPSLSPNDGGQTEMIDDPDLLFPDADATDKICGVLSSPEQQRTLRVRLERRSEMFSAARFVEEARAD